MNVVIARPVVNPIARIEAFRYGLAAILLGIVFVGVACFSHYPAIHDAAHDTRHAVSFPCH